MKISLFLFLAFPLVSFAGPFGSVTLDGLTSGHDQLGCDAEDIIIAEYNKTNIDFVEGTAPYKWDCAGVTPDKAEEKRCPYSQYVKSGMENLRCFSNLSKGPAVCVSGATSKENDETYGGASSPSGTRTSKITRARFKELFTLTQTTGKFRQDTMIRMDDDGCKTQSVRENDTIEVSIRDCNETLRTLLSGSEMPYTDPKMKYCDPQLRNNYDYVSGMLSSVDKIGNCLRLIPNFRDDYTREMLERRNSALSGRTKRNSSGTLQQ